MENIRQQADSIFADALGRLPAQACIVCCNADPSVEGGCFLRLQPNIDLGVKEQGFSTMLQPVSEIQSINPNLVRDLMCEGYNEQEIGYPLHHPKHGGWVCSVCGYYLSKEESADSRIESLPHQLRQCPQCHTLDPYQCDGFYSV